MLRRNRTGRIARNSTLLWRGAALVAALVGVLAIPMALWSARPQSSNTSGMDASSPSSRQVYSRTATIDGLEIFYREAGSRENPTVLLLHGFPTSSHMFRNLIPQLADEYHVIAPDYPGYGYSSTPSVEQPCCRWS